MALPFKGFVVVGVAALALGFFFENASLLTGPMAALAAFTLIFGFWLAYSRYLSASFGLDFVSTLLLDARSFAPLLLLALSPLSSMVKGIESYASVDVAAMATRLFLKLLLALALSAMVAIKAHDHPGSMRVRFHPTKLVAGAGIAFFVVFTALSALEYYSFKIPYPDLTYYEQSLWTTVHGRLMENSLADFNYFGSHLALILFFLVPFYATFPHSITLLVFQNLALALTALGLYLVGNKVTGNKGVSALFAVSYLLYPAMQFFATHEFHAVVFALPFSVFAFYCLLIRRDKLFWLFFALGLASKETVALAYAFLGLYTAFRLRRPKLGAVVFVVSVAWFLFAVYYAIPFFRGEPYAYVGGSENFYKDFGDSGGEVLSRMVFDPWHTLTQAFRLKNIGWMMFMLLPVAFLSLAGLDVLLIALPVIAMNVLATYYATSTIYFQYNDLLIPFVFIAAFFGYRRVAGFVKDGRKTRAILAFMVSAMVLSNIFFSPSPLTLLDPLPTQGGFSFERYTVSETDWELHRVIETMIPEGAAVTVNSPQLVNPLNGRYYIKPFLQMEGAEYVLVDLGRPGMGKSLEAQEAIVKELANKWRLEELYRHDRVLLMRKPGTNPSSR